MGMTVCKILHCHCEAHDEKTPREFEYIYEVGVDPPHTYLCMACRVKLMGRVEKFKEVRTGDLPPDIVRTDGDCHMERRGAVGLRAPWQSVPRKIGGDEEVEVEGAVPKRWGEKGDIVTINQEGRA